MQAQEDRLNLNNRNEKEKVLKVAKDAGISLEIIDILDEGYEIALKPIDEEVARRFYNVTDKIEFPDFIITEPEYKRARVDAVLVPVTTDSMEEFLWDYIDKYLTDFDEIEALFIGIGILEHIAEQLPDKVKTDLEEYFKVIIQ